MYQINRGSIILKDQKGMLHLERFMQSSTTLFPVILHRSTVPVILHRSTADKPAVLDLKANACSTAHAWVTSWSHLVLLLRKGTWLQHFLCCMFGQTVKRCEDVVVSSAQMT